MTMAISTPTLSLFSSPLQPKSLHFRHHPSFSFSSSATSLHQSPSPIFNFPKEISRLQTLISRLREADNLRHKLMVLNADDRVRDFFASTRGLPSLDVRDEFLVKCLVAAGQGHVLGSQMCGRRGGGGGSGLKEALVMVGDMIGRWELDGVGDEGKYEKLMGTLNDVEEFYDCVGGIIG